MITQASSPPFVMRLSAAVAWRSDRRIAEKLHGFSMTEQGSALDMFRASELAVEPAHRRLFLRHGLDESRHARRFREAALALRPDSRPRAHERKHALPEQLYRRLGPERFLAFVHLSEARAERQFRALADRFRGDPERPELAALFADIVREERVHVAYSLHLLGAFFPADERSQRVKKALRRERRALAWAAWKRAGARLGGRAVTLVMALVFFGVLPLFALVQRASRRGCPPPGWHPPEAAPTDLAGARRPA